MIWRPQGTQYSLAHPAAVRHHFHSLWTPNNEISPLSGQDYSAANLRDTATNFVIGAYLSRSRVLLSPLFTQGELSIASLIIHISYFQGSCKVIRYLSSRHMDSGTVIGAVSLGIQAFQLFSSCMLGYEKLLDACEMHSDLAVLRCRLEIEVHRFRLWGEASDIADGNLDLPIRHGSLVLSTLQCIQRLIASQVHKFSNDYSPERASSQSDGPQEGMVTRFTSAFESLSRQTCWIIYDGHRMEATINEVKALNDSLVSFLRESRQSEMAQSFQELSIRVLGTNNLDKLDTLRQSTFGHYDNLSALVELRALRITIDKADESREYQSLRDIMLSKVLSSTTAPRWIDAPAAPDVPNTGALIEVHMHNKTRLILERVALPADSDARTQVISRIEWVSRFLEQASNLEPLRALPFSGLILHPTEAPYVALTYKIPEDASEDADPVSLAHLLQSASRRNLLPSLNDRITLALVLARALLNLHACGWLHKSVYPQHVVFFPREGDDVFRGDKSYPPGFITRPYLKGYAYSRMSENTVPANSDPYHSESMKADTETGFYRHPSTFGAGASRKVFKKTYDLYSFGILLLEIGLWRSCKPDKELSPNMVRQMLSKTYLQGQLAYRTGTLYEEVVRTCLMGDFGEERPERNWIEIGFLERAVKRLESCRV